MIFATHLEILLSASSFINKLDCAKANRIHAWQRCGGDHLWPITDEHIFQTIGQAGGRRAIPAADSIYFPGRLLMQDERSALCIDKAKLWTPAYGLILSFPGKKAANKANPWAASSFTSVSRSPNFRFCFALSTGLSQEAASRKGDLLVTFGHGLIRRHLSSKNFGYVWSHLGTSRYKAQPPTQLLSHPFTICLAALPEHKQCKGRQYWIHAAVVTSGMYRTAVTDILSVLGAQVLPGHTLPQRQLTRV